MRQNQVTRFEGSFEGMKARSVLAAWALLGAVLLCTFGCGANETAPLPPSDGDHDQEASEQADRDAEAEAEIEAEIEAVSATACIADPDCPYPILNAHRGLCGDEPENTIAAFLQCEGYGVPMFEIDLRQTADGRIVLMHDSSVTRTTDGAERFPGRGDVSGLSVAEFKSLVIKDERCQTAPESAPDRCHPATFAELLARTSRESVLFLDFKDGDPQLVAADILAAKAQARVIFFDSDLARLRAYRRAVPGGLVMPRAEEVADYSAFLAAANADLDLRWIHGDPGDAAEVKELLKEKRVRLYFNLFTTSDIYFGTSDMTADAGRKAEYLEKAHRAMDAALESGGSGFGTEFARFGAAYWYPRGFGLPR